MPVAVAQSEGIPVGYLPWLAMRRAADLHPGEAKTHARDAFINANSAGTLPQTLRSVQVADEQVAELSMLCGFDDYLAMPELLAKHPTPAALCKAGKARVETLMRKHAPRVGKRWTQEIFAALDEQTSVVSGTTAAGIVLL